MYGVYYTARHYRKQPCRTARHLMQAITLSRSNEIVSKCHWWTAEMFVTTFSGYIRELLNSSVNADETTVTVSHLQPSCTSRWCHYKTTGFDCTSTNDRTRWFDRTCCHTTHYHVSTDWWELTSGWNHRLTTIRLPDAILPIHVTANNVATEVYHKNGGMFTNQAD